MALVSAVDDIEVSGPGRPISRRSEEIQQAMESAIGDGKHGLRFELEDDEVGEYFYRFTQRARAAAERIGVKVNVSISRHDRKMGNVRILEASE